MSSYFDLITLCEWTTLIAAIFFLNKKTGIWRLFILWQFLSICVEITGWYLREQLHIKENGLPFNILTIITFLFLFYILANSSMLRFKKKQLKLISLFYVLFALTNLFFYQGYTTYNSYSESLGDIILALTCCYILFSFLKDEEEINLVRSEYFWMAGGLIFVSLGSALLFNFSYLLNDYYLKTKIDLGNPILTGLNLILDITLIIAFVCRNKAFR